MGLIQTGVYTLCHGLEMSIGPAARQPIFQRYRSGGT
jgi:hypothetical protein